MRRGIRRAAIAFGIGALACAGLGAMAGSPSVRASLSAAYRAFRDPSLVDGRAASPAAEPRACLPLAAEDPEVVEARIARDFEPPAEEDLDDPDGAAIASLVLPDLRVPLTRRTMRFVRFFARSEEGRAVFLQRYRRAGLYRDFIEHALREGGLPEDLLWVAAIESSFDPRAVSPAGAAGLWQFMPRTGALYGLHQSDWVDERRSLARATTAAVAHLRDLYERLGRWDLALAAYNLGYERVIDAMERVSEARDPSERGPIGIAELAQARAIPEETANYVPQVTAFALVAANRARFGLDLPDLDAVKPLQLGEIAVPEGTRLRTIARAAGVSTAVLREYNPELLRDRTPPKGGDYLVSIPADRVARTLATFPAYLDHEVLAEGDAGGEPPSPLAAATFPAAAWDDEVPPDLDGELPRRPGALGKNRLPALRVPGQELGAMPLLGNALAMDAKLPVLVVGAGVGWSHAFDQDPLGLLGGRSPSRVKGREAAIEKQLGFLDAPQPERVQRFFLPSGVAVELRRDPSAPLVAVSATIAPGEPARAAGEKGGPAPAPPAAGETRFTITVPPRELDVGIDVAAARLRLLLGEGSDARLAALRRELTATRRDAIEKEPYGRSWLALGDALFPPGHPLAGTLVGAREEASAARDLLLAESLRDERRAGRATLAISGDVTRAAVEAAVSTTLARLPRDIDTPVTPHPREERILIEDAVAAPHVLYGWITPPEGDPSEASLRVAMEILTGPRVARLSKVLVTSELAADVRGRLDLGPRAGVAAIELAPSQSHPTPEVERRLDADLEALAAAGPTWSELSLAKALLKIQLEKELARIHGAPGPSGTRPVTAARFRNALSPGSIERLLQSLDDVSSNSVRAIVRRTFSRPHRVVVTTWPRGWSALAAAGAAPSARPE